MRFVTCCDRASATADAGSKAKTGVVNDLPAIDLCAIAIELGCGYVARSFSGDMKQLVALLKGALAHRGTAMLDVISPCVTFNDHDTSTKSYKWAKGPRDPDPRRSVSSYYEEITVDYDPGTTQTSSPRRLAHPPEEAPRRLRRDRQGTGPGAVPGGAAEAGVPDGPDLRRAC
jgi:pyruvate/2-oxoacid:ferredoxin oxidoreductase beta subunit